MVCERFRAMCALRVGLMSATVWAFFGFCWYEPAAHVTIVALAAAAVWQSYRLFHYVERTSRDVTRFLQAIEYDDFSLSFTGSGLGGPFAELKAAFNRVLERFRKTRREREENAHNLQTVFSHAGVGLVCYGAAADVVMANGEAYRLLRTPDLRSLHDLAPFSPELVRTLLDIRAGESALVRVDAPGASLDLSVRATSLTMQARSVTLASLQNIRPELESKQIQSWKEVVHSVTHELSHTIQPIDSLASTLRSMLLRGDPVSGATFSAAMDTIQKSCGRLLRMVDSSRKLTQALRLKLQRVAVDEVLGHVVGLLGAELARNGIEARVDVEPGSLSIKADPDLIAQVLINLVRNAAQALEGRPGGRIELCAHTDGRGSAVIDVIDNGPGIPPDLQDKVFVPLFTTKKDGSGIGLSRSREIVQLHGGTLSVRSEPGVRTVFTVRF